ncbi:ubiquitin family protein [Amphritea pacifica]|uniref:MoaD/ThiS family protein n=1 Tax=Amphritea pacifica TaxID=2811233 RepID=UPI001E4AD8DA|nr:MoaD/ThiS family protein [Amphritea pacifica]
MTRVEITPHLYRFFPMLENREICIPEVSVAEVIQAIDRIAPGFCDYILDEHGALRRHIMLSINETVVIDRKTLSDRIPDNGTLFIFQALTGG